MHMSEETTGTASQTASRSIKIGDIMTATATITRDQNRLNGAVYSDTKVLFDSSNDNGSRERIGVAAGAEQLIFGMLSDLSMNRGAYVLREAYSNAYDATRATGSMDGEIDITIPASITASTDTGIGIAAKLAAKNTIGRHAIVRVSDHGIGMTERDVRRYFLQYGGSKKRNDVDAIGSKGLGAKAPLSVSDVFEVRSRKDGIETTASIARDGDGCYANVTTRKTSRGNGTDVLIPVNDAEVLKQMSECANVLASANIDANLVINGTPAKRLTDGDTPIMQHVGKTSIGIDENGNAIESDVFWYNGITSNSSFRAAPYISYHLKENINVIVGGYPYSLSNAVRGKGAGTSDLEYSGWYVTCEPGYLNFTPSRDAIKSDTHANALLNNIADAIEDIDMSEFMCNMIDAASIGEKITLLQDHSVFSDYLEWVRDESGNVLGFSTNRAFNRWHAYIPAEHLFHKGINLVSLTKHNDVNHFDARYHVPSSEHADLGNASMFTITHAYARSHPQWNINRHDSYERQNIAIAAVSDKTNGELFQGHWTDAIDDCCFNGYYNSRYAIVITNCDERDGFGATVMRSVLSIFRSCFPSFIGGNSGDIIALLLVKGDAGSSIGEAEMDILNAAYDGNVVVKSWDDVTDCIKEYRKNATSHATTRTKHVGDSTVRDFDFSDMSNVTECAAMVNERVLSHSIRYVDAACGGYDGIAFALIDGTGYGSYADGAAFAIGVMMLNGAFPKNVRHACVLIDPYADDIADITRRGGIIAFDIRNKRKQHVHAVVNPGDGYKYGVAIASTDVRSILIDGKSVYADSSKATMTYLAITDSHAIASWRDQSAVRTCITEGFLENTPLDGVFDPQYAEHADTEYMNNVSRLSGVIVTHADDDKSGVYDAGIRMINDAITLGQLTSPIADYAYPYDIKPEGKDVYDVFRAGVVAAFRKSLDKVISNGGKLD